MGSINWPRVLLGGLVAAVVELVIDFLGKLVFAATVREAFAVLHLNIFTTAMRIEWALLTLLGGIFLIWLYAVMRTHFGAGPKTALITGFFVWLITVPFMGAALAVLGMMPGFTLATHVFINLGTLFIYLCATLAGAWIYRDKPASPAKTMPAAA